MRNASAAVESTSGPLFSGLDTTFVLFFLSLEYGRGVRPVSVDGMVLGITLAMVLVLPYFLPSAGNRVAFNTWLAGRSIIALLGGLLGVAFGMSVGTVLPGSLRFFPLTMLIVASMISCYVQFYSLMRLRLVK